MHAWPIILAVVAALLIFVIMSIIIVGARSESDADRRQSDIDQTRSLGHRS